MDMQIVFPAEPSRRNLIGSENRLNQKTLLSKRQKRTPPIPPRAPYNSTVAASSGGLEAQTAYTLVVQ